MLYRMGHVLHAQLSTAHMAACCLCTEVAHRPSAQMETSGRQRAAWTLAAVAPGGGRTRVRGGEAGMAASVPVTF